MFFTRKFIFVDNQPIKYSSIGQIFKKGHSDAQHAIKKVVPNMVQTDSNYALKIRVIENKILEKFKEIDNTKK